MLFYLILLIFNTNNYYNLIEYNSLLLLILVVSIFNLIKLISNSVYLTLHKYCLILLFLFKNIFLFYIFYELSIIPLIYYLLKYNYKYNRIIAIRKLLIYTFIGSFTFIIALILIYYNLGSFNYYLYKIYINNDYINILLLISFIIKVPIYPLHNWLPLVHSEANTIGSIILASILLKIGVYGILTYININTILLNSLISLSLLSIIYSIYSIYKLFDLKKIIAYTSIIHMNYTILTIISNNEYTLSSSYYSIITHAIISSMLFYIIGVIYNQLNTRNYLHFIGLANLVPYISIIIFISFVSNNGLPFTSSFLTELLSFICIFKYNIFILIFVLITIFFNSFYTFNILNKILFGPIKIYIKDLNLSELLFLIPLLLSNFILSLLPLLIINI